jgi:DNA helicase II / ATP-dependent DNA helicase PcrA
MRYITDLEVHSKYARACSPNSDLEHHGEYSDKKGINLVGSGDFTHPVWFKEMQDKFKEVASGVYQLKGEPYKARFMLTAEVSCIYRKNDATRRIHVLLFAPSLESAGKLNKKLKNAGGKLAADGRPILGMDIKHVLEMALEVDKNFIMIPAHVWTPWFGFYGSKSGFDSLEEAFEDLTPYVAGIETGLSSDPPMNWRLKELDSKAIVSFSDAHSPANLAREATVFDLKQLDFPSIHQAIWQGYRTDMKCQNKIDSTLEFFPEEGKYHHDGHRACDVSLNPTETKKNKGICPKCKKPLTVGVLYRVQELADRKEGYIDKTRPPYKSLVPLQEIIAESYGVGKQSKRVETEFERLCEVGSSEFNVLLNLPEDELSKITESLITTAIMRMRSGDLHVVPGFDGVFGKIEMFTDKDRQKAKPAKLF